MVSVHRSGGWVAARVWNLALLGFLLSPAPTRAAAPAITNQPASQTIFYGSPVTFSVGASGTAPLAYQWYRDGARVGGATTNSYTPATVSSNDQGAGFSVIVS